MKVINSLSLVIFLLGVTQITQAASRSNHSVNWSHQDIIADLQDELDRLKEQLQNERVLRVVALSQPANFGQAETLFNQLNNVSLIDPIMAALYGDPYHESLVGFTKALHTLPERLLAYHKWVELLQDNQGLLSGGILVLKELISQEIRDSGGSPAPELVEMDAKLEVYGDTVLNIWGRDIQRGRFEEVLDFVSPRGYHLIGKIFEGVVDSLVAKILGGGELEHFKRGLEFVTQLRWNMHRYLGLKAVYDQMTDGRRLMVAFKIKEVMEGCFGGPDPPEPVKQLFQELKENMSANVKQLLWHQECNFFNKINQQYLYGDREQFDANNKRVFTWIPTGQVPEGSPWKLTPSVNLAGDGLVFRVESNYYPDYKFLEGHSTGLGNGDIRKFVSLQRNVPSEYNWRVDLSALEGEVMLYYLPLKGYLMADIFPHDGQRISAIIWKTEELDPTTHVWTLECV